MRVEDSVVTIVVTESHGPMKLTEAYPNGYVFGPLTVHFLRNQSGTPIGLTLTLHGVRRLRYERLAATLPPAVNSPVG